MSTKRYHYLVVYGTLQKHFKTPMHILINESTEYSGPCELQGRLYSLGRYPGFKLGDGKVYGELYKIINPNVLPHLDAYEAVDNEDSSKPGFKRILVKLIQPEVSAWVYHYEGDIQTAEYIRSGSWVAFQDYLKKARL